MELLIYDVKIQTDPQSVQFLGNAVAGLYFYHGTVIKVYFTNRYIDKKLKYWKKHNDSKIKVKHLLSFILI